MMIGAARKDIGPGSFPDVRLAETRDKARVTKERIQEKRAPVSERKQDRHALIKEQKSARLNLTRTWGRLQY